jgi:hypothetical protein
MSVARRVRIKKSERKKTALSISSIVFISLSKEWCPTTIFVNLATSEKFLR